MMSMLKDNKRHTHKSNWKTITVNGKEYQLDCSGRLINKFSKNEPRKYFKDLQIYQNKVQSETNFHDNSIIPNQEIDQDQNQEQDQDKNPKVDSSNKTNNNQEFEFIFSNNRTYDDQYNQSDSCFDLGFDGDDSDNII